MRQAEPAVCALAQLGEAELLLGQALVQSPFPRGLNAEQRKLYRDALAEKAQPIYADARDSLNSADARARELGVTGPCPARGSTTTNGRRVGSMSTALGGTTRTRT